MQESSTSVQWRTANQKKKVDGFIIHVRFRCFALKMLISCIWCFTTKAFAWQENKNLHLDVGPSIESYVFLVPFWPRIGKKGVLPVLVHTYSSHKTLMKCTFCCFSAMLGTLISFSPLSPSLSSTCTILFVENRTQSMCKCVSLTRANTSPSQKQHTTDKCQSLKSMKTCA